MENINKREVISHWLSEQNHYHVNMTLNSNGYARMQGFSTDLYFYSAFSLDALVGFVIYWKRFYLRD